MQITLNMLRDKVNYLNKTTGQPPATWTRAENGAYQANLGNYHLEEAYGGVSLLQVVNEGGGVHDVFGCGHVTKRDLFNRLCAYIEGVEVMK